MVIKFQDRRTLGNQLFKHYDVCFAFVTASTYVHILVDTDLLGWFENSNKSLVPCNFLLATKNGKYLFVCFNNHLTDSESVDPHIRSITIHNEHISIITIKSYISYLHLRNNLICYS